MKTKIIFTAFLIIFFALIASSCIHTHEYGEWKTGRRNEAASFAVQPFINQFGGAASKGIVSLALFFSGVTMMLNEFDAYLVANGITDSLMSETIKKDFIANLPDYAGWVIKLFMMILPLICILASFIIYSKKFKIDEKFYAKILQDLEDRKNSKVEK